MSLGERLKLRLYKDKLRKSEMTRLPVHTWCIVAIVLFLLINSTYTYIILCVPTIICLYSLVLHSM